MISLPPVHYSYLRHLTCLQTLLEKKVEPHGRSWKVMEGHGKSWNLMESSVSVTKYDLEVSRNF